MHPQSIAHRGFAAVFLCVCHFKEESLQLAPLSLGPLFLWLRVRQGSVAGGGVVEPSRPPLGSGEEAAFCGLLLRF